jgi:hypothetical protein
MTCLTARVLKGSKLQNVVWAYGVSMLTCKEESGVRSSEIASI